MTVRAVMGLMQDPDNKKILVVRKAKEPYAGYFGLPAGNLKDGESPFDGIVRKFEEELGIKTTTDEWTLRATLGDLAIFYAQGSIGRAQKKEDEAPYHLPHDANLVREPLMPDLQFIIPLVLHYHGPEPLEVY